MDMIKFAICDDEPSMAREISRHLAAYMEKTPAGPYCVGSFSSGRALLEGGGDFDVIFLDIQMEPPNGMETAKILRRQGSRSLLIFVTVLKEPVFDAFEVEAYDYLTKPLDGVRFQRTMDRAIGFLERRSAKGIVIRQRNGCQVIPPSEIIYCEVQGRKLYLHRSGGEVTDHYGKLEDFARRVDGRFFRCHRSYLVNLDYVCGCHSGQVVLPLGQTIPVSRLRERELTQALLRHMKEVDP